jgi:hypothetical protein
MFIIILLLDATSHNLQDAPQNARDFVGKTQKKGNSHAGQIKIRSGETSLERW